MTLQNIRERRLHYQQKTTQMMLETEGQTIALQRPAPMVSDNAGSMTRQSGGPTQLPPAVRCLFGLTMLGRGVNQQPERWHVTDLGERQKIVYVMIGPPGDDVQENDFWQDDAGNVYRVAFVHLDRTYQTKAEILLIGKSGGG